MANRLLALLCATGVLAQLSACGGGGGGDSNPPPPVNAAPNFGGLAFSGTEDTDLSARAGATDPEGAAVTFTSTTQPAHGTLVSLNATTGEFLYRPNANYFGTDTFDVRAQDPAGNARAGTVTLTIASVNDLPQVSSLSIDTDEEIASTGTISATDADNETLTINATQPPANGTLQNLGASGSFTYVPNRGYTGADVFELRVSDAAGATATATVNVTVRRTSPQYTGSTAPVAISEGNATRSARSAWLALKIVAVIGDSGPDRVIAPGPVDLTIDGDEAGTLRLTGALSPAGTGSLTGTFSGFEQDGVTLDGLAYFDILDARTANSARVQIWPRSLRYRDQHLDATISGRLLRDDTSLSALPNAHLTGELLAIEASGVQHRFADVSFDATREYVEAWTTGINHVGVRTWTGTARAYDSRHGYVDVSTSPGFRFIEMSGANDLDPRSDVSRAYPDGSLVTAGTGAMRVWLTPLSPEAFSLEVNRTGTTPNVSVAHRWEDDFAASAGSDTGRPLLAVTSKPTLRDFGHNGAVFRPEGRFSEHAGGHFVRHQWRFVYVPPGSNAQLEGANTTRPSFVPDVSGDYVLKLVVSEGATTSSDYLFIESVPPGEIAQFRGQRWPFSRAVPGGAPNTALGEEFVLDGRRTYLDYFHPRDGFGAPLLWSVWEWESQQYILVNAPGPVLNFTAPRIGNYHASLYMDGFSSVPLSDIYFSVGEAPRFLPRVRSQLGFASVDWDGDGDLDSINVCSANGLSYLSVLIRDASGRYGSPQCMTNAPLQTSSTNYNIHFEDLSGDGRLDVIWLFGPSVRVALQQAGGALSPFTQLDDRACNNGSASARFDAAVDIDRNGRPDPVRVVCDGSVSSLVYNPSNTDGTFGPATVIPTTAGQLPIYSTSADIDGDGDREILAITSPNAPWQSFTILSLNNGGTFDTTTVPVTFSFTPTHSALRIVDLNNDGRLDLIGGGTHLYTLTQNSDGSFTQRSRNELDAFSANTRPAVGDVNGDGRVDVGYAGVILLQQANGSFQPLEGLAHAFSELVDVDLDGRADFLQPDVIDLNPTPD